MAVIVNPAEVAPSKEQEADNFFEKEDYERCLQVLEQVTLSPGKEAKLVHNRAIAEFYQAGGKDAQVLQEKLEACQARCDELSRAAEAELDSAVSPSGASTLRDFSADGGSRATEPYCWDYQTGVLTFNQALLHYQQHRYSQAASLLEPLYTNMEPLDEGVALRVCLLLLDVHLANRQPGKAANVLTFLEKLFSVYFPATWLTAHSRDERPRSHSESRERGESADRGEYAEPGTRPGTPAESSSVEGGHSRNASEENLDDEAAEQTRGRNGKGFEGLAGFSKPLPIGAEELKLRLHLGRARLLLLTQNLKSSKRELKAALAQFPEHTQALNLKAQLECARGNFRKATKLLVSAHKPDAKSRRTGQSSRAAFLANLGNVHHALGKRSLASLYSSKALAEVPRSLAESAQADGQAVLYSAAVEQLVAGNPVAAAQCFQQVEGRSPIKMLRLGEACIAAHRKGLLGSRTSGGMPEAVGSYGDKQVRVTVTGESPWTAAVLREEDGGRTSGIEAGTSGVLGGGDLVAGLPAGLSLGYARECFEAVLAQLEGAGQTEAAQTERVGGEPSSSRQMANGVVEARKSNGDSVHKRTGNGKAGNGEPAAAEDGMGSSEVVRPRLVAPISLGQGSHEPGLRQVVLSSSLKAGLAAHEAEQKRRNEVIRQSAKMGLAYVDLCHGNSTKALSQVEGLLKAPGLGRVNSLLARTYAAEALCLLGRSGEAIDHLSVALTDLTNSSSEPLPPVPEQGPVQDREEVTALPIGRPRDIQAELTGPGGRAALYVNLAALYARKGELAEAQRCVGRAAQICRDSPPVLVAGILVDLRSGIQAEALSKLTDFRKGWTGPSEHT